MIMIDRIEKISNLKEVTIIFYDGNSLELKHETKHFPQNAGGRVNIPNKYRNGKSIIAICEGTVNILNKMGDRAEPFNVQSA
jgi:uncharacterized protein (TIGR02922 family)